MSKWLNLPVSTAGHGPILNNQASPTDWSSWEFKNQFYEAIEEKDQLLNGCGAEFPPPSIYWATGNNSGVTHNASNAVFSFTGVNWGIDPGSGCTGSLWSGRSCSPCIGYIPQFYDLITIGDYFDQYTWLRNFISSMTYDSNTSTGTLTVPVLPLLNAVTAGFIPSIDSLAGGQYRITKSNIFYGGGAGLTSRDRRPMKPNQREFWRGSVVTGWIDDSGNGQIFEQNNTVDPSPYDTDGGDLPLVNWPVQLWKAKKPSQAMFFDTDGVLHRVVVNGNDKNHVGFNQSIYQLTVNASSGTFDLSYNASNISGGTLTNTISPAFDATASTIQTDLAAFNKMSGLVTVSGVGPFTISFDASLGFVNLTSDSGAIVNAPSGAKTIVGNYILCGPGDTGAPGRIPEPRLAWYYGVSQGYKTHGVLDDIDDVNKPVYNIGWNVGNVCDPINGCNSLDHDALDVDAKIEDDNNCEPGRAGDWLAPQYYFSWRHLQMAVVDRWTKFINMQMPFGLGDITAPYNYTTVGWSGFTRVWRQRHKKNHSLGAFIADGADSGIIDPPAVTPGGFLPDPDAPALSLGQNGNISYGIICSYRISALNGSGETNASTGATVTTASYQTSGFNTSTPITTSTYSINLTWTPELGASSYNIYGQRNGSGGELFLINVSAYSGTWTDDGSLTPAGPLPSNNSTSTNCFGVGTWIFRSPSMQYLSATTDGFINDGGFNLSTNTISRCVGNNWQEAFTGRGPMTTSLPDSPYWDRTFCGHYRKRTHLARTNHSSGSIIWSNTYSIFNPSLAWWNDGVNVYETGPSGIPGVIRVQGGNLNGGSGTTATDTQYNNFGTSKACWFSPTRYAGSYHTGPLDFQTPATPFAFFTMEIYSGGTPAGWSFGEDGTATYSAPAATGHSGTYTSGAPTISGVTPALLHATGLAQPVFIQGNNFQTSGCVVTLTSPDGLTIIPITPDVSDVTAGELSLSVAFPRGTNGSWGAIVTNPDGNHSSASFAFGVNLMQEVPILNFSGGVFTFPVTLDTAAASGDGYLILEPSYEPDRWNGRVFRMTPEMGDPVELVCRYSSNRSLFFDQQSNAPTGTFAAKEINLSTSEQDQYDFGASLLLTETKPTVKDNLVWCEAPPDGSTPRYWVHPILLVTDARGGKFRVDIMRNLETKMTDFGYYQILDDFGPHIPNEMYDLLKEMQWVRWFFDWQDPTGGDLNSLFYPVGDGPGFMDWGIYSLGINFAAYVANLKTSIGPPTNDPGTTPRGILLDHNIYYIETDDTGGINTSVQNDDGAGGATISQGKNYGHISPFCAAFPSNIVFYTYGWMDGLDTTPASTDSTTTTFVASGGRQGQDITFIEHDTDQQVFNNAGFPVTWHQWQDFSTISAGSGNLPDLYSDPLGSVDTSAWPPMTDPTVPPIGTDTGNFRDILEEVGWFPGYKVAIRKYTDLNYGTA